MIGPVPFARQCHRARRRIARCCATAALALLPAAGLAAGAAASGKVTVAAAANLQVMVDPLQTAFAAQHPDLHLTFITAGTGNLVAQIRHGAPFDVLLAADLAYPQALIESGEGLAATLRVFAQGQLVLWPAHGLTAETWATSLRSNRAGRIAIANPATAPYGAAARAVLETAGLWEALQPQLVRGENIAQTLQFVTSGNAAVGFVARAQVDALPPTVRGGPDNVVLFPARLPHGALLLRRAEGNAAARIFLAWLAEPDTVALFTAAGYAPPDEPAARTTAAPESAAP